MRDRTRYFVGWVLLLVGALLVGNVLRQVFFESAMALVSGQALAGLAGGAALVLLGWRIERRSDPSEFVGDPDPGADDEEWTEEDYIFSDEDLEGRADRRSE